MLMRVLGSTNMNYGVNPNRDPLLLSSMRILLFDEG